jgi:hypothetical protein
MVYIKINSFAAMYVIHDQIGIYQSVYMYFYPSVDTLWGIHHSKSWTSRLLWIYDASLDLQVFRALLQGHTYTMGYPSLQILD